MKRFPTSVLLLLASAMLVSCGVNSPGRVETYLATRVKRHVTVGGSKLKDPLPVTPESIAAGKRNFGYYCYACHGLDGQNTGVPFAEHMSPPVPPLNSPSVQAYSDGQLRWIIENGISPSGMPAAKGILNDQEMWEIVHYVRHLPAKGSLGEPKAYSGE
ncbi:MAG TPA: cytochrome c [Terriglobales bacterium]|nr:cytochrome c [Terriglobales bacterium]